MGFNYTTTELLADIKRKAFIPISQTTFSDADLLDMADEELQIGVVPLIMSTREEYFVTYFEYEVQGDTNEFAIPPRAIGAKLRNITVVVNNSSGQDGTPNEVSLPQIDADQSAFNNNYNNYLAIQAFYLRNNEVKLSPSANVFSGQILRLYYFNRPNKLIEVSECSQITAIAGNVCTVNVIPADFGTGSLYTITSDVVKSRQGFKNLAEDIELTVNTTDSTITFPVDPNDLNITVGDYICLAGDTPVPQIPVELHTLLAQRTAVKVLESLGDEKNFALASKKLAEMQKSILGMISNRVEGASRKVVNNYSTLNSSNRSRWW